MKTPILCLLVYLLSPCGDSRDGQPLDLLGGLLEKPLFLPSQPPANPARVVPQTVAHARDLVQALDRKLKALRGEKEKKNPLISLVAEQKGQAEAILASLSELAALPEEKKKLQAGEQQDLQQQRQLISQGGGRLLSGEVSEGHSRQLRQELETIELEFKREKGLLEGFVTSREASAQRKKLLEGALDQAEAALKALRATAGPAPGEVYKEQFWGETLKTAAARLRLKVWQQEQSLDLPSLREKAARARIALLDLRRRLVARSVRHLGAQLKRLQSDKLYQLKIKRQEFLERRAADHLDPLLKPYWSFRVEAVEGRMAALAAQAQRSEWALEWNTGELKLAQSAALDLGEILADEEVATLGLAQLHALRKASEKRLEQVQKANLQISALSARTTHDLRTANLARRGLQTRLDQARTQAEKAEDIFNEAADPASWDDVANSLDQALGEELTALSALKADLIGLKGSLRTLETRVRQNLVLLDRHILWTRTGSSIGLKSLQRWLRDLPDLDNALWTMLRSWGAAAADLYTRAARRGEALLATLMALGLLLLLLLVRHRLPATFSWIEDQERGPKGRASRVLAAVLRRTHVAFAVAVVMVGVPAILDLAPKVLASLAVVFATPFIYRFLRVLLDILCQPEAPQERLLQVEQELARVLHRAGRLVLNISLFFIPAGLLMGYAGYNRENPGFVELWWLLYRIGINVILLFALLRPSVVVRFIRGKGRMATQARNLILLIYPLLVAAELFVSVLYSLNYEEAAAFFTKRLLKSGGILLLALFLYRFLLRAARPGVDFKRTVQREDFEKEQDFVAAGRQLWFDRLARVGIRVVVFIPALFIILGYWPDWIWSFLKTGLIEKGGLSAGELLGAALAVWVTFGALRTYRQAMIFLVMPRTRLDRGVRYTITTLSSYALMTVGLIVALRIVRVKGDQIGFVLSALALGIGFGLQSIIRNLVSGIILLVERPVKVGDWVEVGGKSGKVDKITIRATRVMTWDGVGVVIPNEQLIGGTLVNASLGSPRLRSEVRVGVAYGSPVRRVKELLLEATSSHGLVLKRPAPEVFFVSFGDSSLDFMVRFWTSMNASRVRVRSDVRALIEAKFREEGIEIPFPQRDLNLRELDPRLIQALQGSLPETDPVPPASPLAEGEHSSGKDALGGAQEEMQPRAPTREGSS